MIFWIANPRELVRPNIPTTRAERAREEGGGVLAFEGEHEAPRGAEAERGQAAASTAEAAEDAEETTYHEIAHEDGAEEEVQQHRRLGNPIRPSEAEVDEHCKTHLPYRSWCAHCVMGRGVGTQHYSRHNASSIPRVGLEFFYLTQGGVKLRSELTEAEPMPWRYNDATGKRLSVC